MGIPAHQPSSARRTATGARQARSPKKKHTIWTPQQLGAFLRAAFEDRYNGMRVLAATTGMRRSELAGVERSMVDLENGTLTIEDTRVVVAGKAQASDGKSVASQRDISLDNFTVRHLRSYIDRMNEEREAFGKSYPNHDYLMVGPEGRPLHPDTIIALFNRLVDKAGVPRSDCTTCGTPTPRWPRMPDTTSRRSASGSATQT